MARKKSEQPELSDAEQVLVRRVDSLMSTEPLPPEPDKTKEESKHKKKEPLKIVPIHHDSDEMQTAPKLPANLWANKPDEELPKPRPVPERELPPMPALPVEADPPETPDAPDSPKSTEAPDTDPPLAGDIESSDTDKAVDDIVAKEGDTILALEDAKTKRNQPPVKAGFKDKLRALFTGKRFWVVLLIILLIVFALPMTRYTILGLVWKKPVNMQIVDSKTATPVSNAVVTVDGTVAKTDADGKVHLNAGLGKQKVTITKQYYTSADTTYFVGFKATAATTVKLVATGRLVPVKVRNSISGKPLANVQIKILNTVAKTNAKGQASVAVPVGKNSLDAHLTLAGYNPTLATVTVTDKVVKANTLSITPAGQVYFLSNASGNIDVVKSNLDGSDRKTVLAGTGQEEKGSTSLLASRDWHYLVLKARRDTPQAALYLIDTNTDKVTKFDASDSDFTLVGWYNHSFVYELARNGQSDWTAGTRLLKSYDADHQQLNQLDQNQAEGTSTGYAYQDFSNFYILNDSVTYTTQWYNFANYDISAKTDTIRAIEPTGQNKKDYQTFPSATTVNIQAALYEPQAVYYSVYSSSDSKTTYYEYEDQAVKTATVDPSTFNAGYPTYLLSPSGNQTFWTELRDGKNTLFTGDASAANKKQVATLSDYTPYGWYGDDYTLVSKNGSELYIMPASGASVNQPPVKVTDYYKPAQNFAGYGYGYGGL